MAFRPDDNVKHVCYNVMLQMRQQRHRVIWVYTNVLLALSHRLQVAIDACMHAELQNAKPASRHRSCLSTSIHAFVHQGPDICGSAHVARNILPDSAMLLTPKDCSKVALRSDKEH